MTRMNRRALVGAGMAASLIPAVGRATQGTPVSVEIVDRLVIDLPAEPVNIHPAKAYSDLEWAVVHSIFDALIGFDQDGNLLPVSAETFELVDEMSWLVTLRDGMTFHDGEPVTSAAIVRGFDLVSGSDSLVSDIFGVVDTVEEVDNLTARITVSTPSPWLPAQMASWHVLVPENFDPARPVGSGPYRFDQWSVGSELVLNRYEHYLPSPTKGQVIAESVTYHFVPDATTRISNVLSGSSDIASFLPIDALAAFEEGSASLRRSQVAGTWFIRIATDVAPFDDVRVRQALNLALDLDAFVGVLVHEGSSRLATLFPGEFSMGYDPDLAPYAYDPDAARALLEEAGYGDGLSVRFEAASDASPAVCEALIGQWAEVGIKSELLLSDLGTFNATWTDPDAPALRMTSWSPMFDPSTLLNLVWHSDGILSRSGNPEADRLIDLGGSVIGDEREDAYRSLGQEMHDDAAAVFLWNLVHVAAITEKAAAWTPRPDQWVMALSR